MRLVFVVPCECCSSHVWGNHLALFCVEKMCDADRPVGGVSRDKAHNFQILPDDEILHGPKIKRLEGILHPETVFTRILRYLIHKLLQQFFFLQELDGAQGIRGQLNGLVEPVLPP